MLQFSVQRTAQFHVFDVILNVDIFTLHKIKVSVVAYTSQIIKTFMKGKVVSTFNIPTQYLIKFVLFDLFLTLQYNSNMKFTNMEIYNFLTDGLERKVCLLA